MSDQKPDGPYIYQPYGMQDKFHWGCGRIYGLDGLGSHLIEIKGLKKDEVKLLLKFIIDNKIGEN